MKRIRSHSLRAVTGAIVACVAVAAQAATITWQSNDGTLGDNTLWSNANNWVGGVAPVAGDDLTFPAPVAGGSRTTNNDLPANTQINGVLLPANQYVLNGNAINLGGGVTFSAGGANLATIGLTGNMLQDTTYSVAANTSNGRLQVDGNITGNFGLIKADAGRLRFGGTAKTYSGNTTVTGGILDFGADNQLPFGAGKGSLFLGTGTQFILNNVNGQINGLNDFSGGAGAVSKNGSNTRNLTLGNGDASGSFSGGITFTGGNSSVIKTGTGTQTLGGAISVVGPLQANAGRLNLNGTVTGGVNVGTGGTLGGTGTINPVTGATNGNQLVQINGTVSPGLSPGTLSINGPVSFGSAAILNFELNGGNTIVGGGVNDLIDLVTNLTLDGVLNVSETVAGSFATAANGSKWRLINYSGTLVDNVLTLGTTPTIPLGASLAIDTAAPGQVNLVYTVPEPASWLVALLAFAVGGMVRRR